MVQLSLLSLLALLAAPAAAGTCEGMSGVPGDLDGDGFLTAADCDDADAGVWQSPGEVQNLRFQADKQTLSWDALADLGGTRPAVYNVYRSSATILVSSDCFDPVVELAQSVDGQTPPAGGMFAYLVQGQNDCATGGVGPGRGPLACDCTALCDDLDPCTEDTCSNGGCVNTVVAPRIRVTPFDTEVCAGGMAGFSVLAEGAGPLSYQWRKDGLPVGLDSPVLSLSGVPPGDDGAQFSVEVTDSCATASSATATLSVFGDPASCAGGLDGFERPNGASDPDLRLYRSWRWEPSAASRGRRNAGHVLPHSGEFVLTEVDLTLPGRGFDLVWGRAYRSHEPLDSVQGRQWTHTYDRRVASDPAVPGNLLVHDGSAARIDSYAPSPVQPGCWEGEGFFRLLCEQPDGRYVMSFPDRHEWIFRPLDGAPAEGRIEASVDRNGNAMFFNYDPAGRLGAIVDTLGRPLQLTYDADGFIATVVDFSGRQWDYEYYQNGDDGGSFGDLKSVTTPAVVGTPTGNDFPAGKTTTYTYTRGFVDERLNHDLLTIADGAGQVYLQNVYATTESPADGHFDRVMQQNLLDGEINFTYVTRPGAASVAIVNDRVGNVTEYEYDVDLRLTRELHYTGRADPLLPTDGSTNRPAGPLRASDPPVFETTYEYDTMYLMTRTVRAEQDELRLQYDTLNPDPRLRANLQQRLWLPGPLGGDQPTIVESWGHASPFGSVVDGAEPVLISSLAQDAGGNGGSERKRLRGAGPASALASAHRTFYLVVGAFEGAVPTGGMTKSELISELAEPTPRAGAGSGGSIWLGVGVADSDASPGNLVRSGGVDDHGNLNWNFGASFPTSYTDGRGLTYAFGYDANGNLTSAQAPVVTTGVLGGGVQPIAETFQYNAFGQLTRHTDPAGRTDRFDYYPGGSQAGLLQSVVLDDPGAALTTTYEYDTIGNLTRTIDPRGNDTEYAVNQLDQLVRVTSPPPFNEKIDFYYTPSQQIERIDVEARDQDGLPEFDSYLTTRYEYDVLSRMTRVSSEVDTGGACVVEEYDYDANDNPAERRQGEATDGDDPLNRERFLYDERDLLFRSVRAPSSPDESTNQYDYDGNARLTLEGTGFGDPAGAHLTEYAYDGYSRLTLRTDPAGTETSYGYDANGRVTSLRVDGELLLGGGLGPVRLYEADVLRDEANRAVQLDEHHFTPGAVPPSPVGDGLSTTRRFYDAGSRQIRVEDDNAHGTDYAYDSMLRLTRITDADSNVTEFEYDANANVTRATETEIPDVAPLPEIFVTEYEYDSLNRLTLARDPLGNETSHDYDSRDNLRLESDPLDNETLYSYDGMSRLTRTTRVMTDDGTGSGVPIDEIDLLRIWDDSSRLVAREDDLGFETTYEYDSLNRLTRTIHADGTADVLTRGAHDTVVQELDPDGTQQSNTYDELDRLVLRTIAPGPGVGGSTFESYAYDGLGRLRRAQDDDTTVTYEYDSLGYVTREIQQLGVDPPRETDSSHDGVGNATQVTYPGGRIVVTLHDPLDRPQTILSNGLLAATYDYVGPGRVERVSRGNGVTTSYEYDGAKRLTRKLHQSGGPPVEDDGFAYDPVGNLTLSGDLLPGGLTTEYEYDSMYRLTRSVRSSGGPPDVIDYDLDGAGSRSLVTGGPDAGAYVLDPALPEPADRQVHQYTATPLGGWVYDRNGDSIDPPGVVDNIVFGPRGEIVAYTYTDGGGVAYSYDALGRRVQSIDTALGQTLRYCYDDDRVVEERDGLDAPRLTYVWGLYVDEALLLQESQDLNANLFLDDYWYLGDRSHSVRALTDGGGGVVERYAYGDYGSPEITNGFGVPLPESAVGNPYLFTGRRYDAGSGLYYYRTRTLDPRAGRYLQPDPGGTWSDEANLGNRLSYAGNNPATFVEPAGARVDRTQLKSYFETGHKPTEGQFGNLIDSALATGDIWSDYNIHDPGAAPAHGARRKDEGGRHTPFHNRVGPGMEDLLIDAREMTTGADWDYRVYGPGDAHYGSITIRARMGNDPKGMYVPSIEPLRARNTRKQISVICLKRDGGEARRFNALECYPTKWDSGDYSPSSKVACETVVCKMGRVELN